jgi:hypothetical protein
MPDVLDESDEENLAITDERAALPPAPTGPRQPGTASIPVLPPNGASFTYWSHGIGLPHTLYLVFPVDTDEHVITEWAAGFVHMVQSALAAQKYMRARSAQKAAERAANQPPASQHVHRPRRVSLQQPAQQNASASPPSPQTDATRTAHAQAHPTAPAASQDQLAQEAQIARARVENKRKVAEATQLLERFASSVEGSEVMRRILAEAEARRAAIHPPGSPGAAVMAAHAASSTTSSTASSPTTPPTPPLTSPPTDGASS